MKLHKLIKNSLLTLSFLSMPLLVVVSCAQGENNMENDTMAKNLKVATFNISFATDNDPTENFKRWYDYLSIKIVKQNELIQKLKNNNFENNNEKSLAERIVQIRNVAAIIQKNRPDVLLLNEFNNDGTNQNNEIIKLFQENYLSIGQSLNSIDGGDLQEPIEYPFYETYATNTGLNSNMDLDNDGKINSSPNDNFGFGYYHGHYAFALMSKYEIDKNNTRTFQNFKWKDLPGAEIPKIEVKSKKIPKGMNVGDNWFTDEEWNNYRLSSKNHVDVPIKINVNNKVETIHLLLSHPTPPAFEIGGTKVNLKRNMAEIKFWKEYVENNSTLYDDNGKKGGLGGQKEKFIILGDLNADNLAGNSNKEEGIIGLVNSPLINQENVNGKFEPISAGAKEEANKNNHPKPETRTSVFGLRVDWTLPSANLEILNSGIYWAGETEKGRLLFNDSRIGQYGNSKEISSDHRLVWTTIKL
ncbi:MAG: endonuclease/exonuclease/phosphatase family protein [Metamycoplasmataceae bacterium]